MFDIGFPELLIVSVVALLVLGPERLPEALRTLGLWFGRMRRSFSAVKVEIEREIGMDEVRRQLHNEAILEEMRALESDVGQIGNTLHDDKPLDDGRSHADAGEAPDDVDDVDGVDEGEGADGAPAADQANDTSADESGTKTAATTRTSYTDDFDESDIVNEPHPDDRPAP